MNRTATELSLFQSAVGKASNDGMPGQRFTTITTAMCSGVFIIPKWKHWPCQ